jgi:hypothetical protein
MVMIMTMFLLAGLGMTAATASAGGLGGTIHTNSGNKAYAY